MQIDHRYYDVNGLRLHVAEAGKRGGEVMLFLHGYPECWYGWKAQLEYFAAKGYHAVAPDLRGYNLSSKPAPVASYRVSELVSDLVALAGQLTGKPVVLIGHDWGGVLAWKLAEQHPGLLRKLIIINMAHPDVMQQTLKKNIRQLLKSWYIGFFQLPLLPEWASRVFDCALLERSMTASSNPGTFSPADMEHYKSAWKQPGALTSMINWYRAVIRYRKPERAAATITVPTLLIWGKKDRFLSHTMAQPSISRCSNGKLMMIEDATHWVHHEKPEVNGYIEDFIESGISLH